MTSVQTSITESWRSSFQQDFVGLTHDLPELFCVCAGQFLVCDKEVVIRLTRCSCLRMSTEDAHNAKSGMSAMQTVILACKERVLKAECVASSEGAVLRPEH